jgi:hypothetical protein
MPSKRQIQYANNEVNLAKSYLQLNPEDEVQKDRLAWWSAFLGDLDTAKQYAVSDKVKEYIATCETL